MDYQDGIALLLFNKVYDECTQEEMTQVSEYISKHCV